MAKTIGTDVTARGRLLGAEAPFSFHEDVLLEVVTKNGGPDRIEIPDLLQSDRVILRLKTLANGSIREANTLLPVPGVPSLSETIPLDGGKEITYKLLIQVYFGQIGSGEYELQISIASLAFTYTSPWMNFSVLPLRVMVPAAARSAEAHATQLNLNWIDTSVQPNRLLSRTYEIDESELVRFTTRIADLPASIHAIASPSAPPGVYGDIGWYAWASGSVVTCLMTSDNSAVSSYTFKIDPPSSVVGSTLIYPDPQTETGCSVLLKSDALDGPRTLMGLEVTSKGVLSAIRRHSLNASADHVVLTHLAPERRWVFWSQKGVQGKTEIHSLGWPRSRGFTLEQVLHAFDVPVLALDARCQDGVVRVAALLYVDPAKAPPSPYSGGTVVMLEAPATDGEWKALKPIVHRLNLPEPPVDTHLALADDGAAWVLARGNKGLWLGGSRLDAPVLVTTTAKASNEMLYIQWDQTPRVLFLDPVAGWSSTTPQLTP